jgi:hypothetical protein
MDCETTVEAKWERQPGGKAGEEKIKMASLKIDFVAWR